ncbi:uncharacterized protein B0T15DRAFT_576092 [Chaetomium strumarium]|uniref:Potassium channel tetramerisation-type BTB domain-containing protein n=1 Tax=Chaetomium strumarium TaxID=1170767 RepID=A0AAJ0GRD0_9PEZI|nr:hypothetical protein B0T15DRAFT_576092 [Chaetomium strumarium]
MDNSDNNLRERSATSTSLDTVDLDSTKSSHHIPKILPHERVFPIQIGSELFKLSGASISSDAPSYFSQYFRCQIKRAEEAGQDLGSAIRTLYIDRDPVTFRDISLHLQGYHVQPRDSTHFVRLFADAQFYHLPKLISQLYEDSIFTTVGGRQFYVPRNLFTDPGNSPNFFTLGFAILFSNPDDLFPGLDREGLLRPPSIQPPSIPGRSAEIFAELLHLLKGYPVNIRSEAHRAELLRDCRYFNFKGLEQKLIPHAISFNLARGKDEIVLRLKDVLKSGISVASEPTSADPFASWVRYARPYVDERSYELVLEIGEETTRLRFPSSPDVAANARTVNARAEFLGETRSRMAKLLEIVATRLNLPPTTQPISGFALTHGEVTNAPPTIGNTPVSEDWVKVVLDPDASVVLDGKLWNPASEEADLPFGATASMEGMELAPRKRKRVDEQGGEPEEWVVRTGQWRVRIQGAKNGKAAVECCMVAVKLDAFTSERARNAQRPFLG